MSEGIHIPAMDNESVLRFIERAIDLVDFYAQGKEPTENSAEFLGIFEGALDPSSLVTIVSAVCETYDKAMGDLEVVHGQPYRDDLIAHMREVIAAEREKEQE